MTYAYANPLNNIISVEKNEMITIQVDKISKALAVSGRVHSSANWQELVALDSNYNFVNKINKTGIYTIDVNGLMEINISGNADDTIYVSFVK